MRNFKQMTSFLMEPTLHGGVLRQLPERNYTGKNSKSNATPEQRLISLIEFRSGSYLKFKGLREISKVQN